MVKDREKDMKMLDQQMQEQYQKYLMEKEERSKKYQEEMYV